MRGRRQGVENKGLRVRDTRQDIGDQRNREREMLRATEHATEHAGMHERMHTKRVPVFDEYYVQMHQ